MFKKLKTLTLATTFLVSPDLLYAEAPAATTTSAVDFHQGYAAIAEKCIPAVVNVSTTQVAEKGPSIMMPGMGNGNPLEDFFKEFMEQGGGERSRRIQSLGSGFIIKVEDGEALIVTNYHVVAEAKKISIILHDKTEVDAVIHSSDERTDLALLKIKLSDLPEDKRKLTVLEWGDSTAAKVGHFVLAIGNPFGLGSTVTSGIISGKGRDIVLRNKNRATDFVDDFIQHDASINMGNSGGALLNTKGEVIGINTAIFSPSGGSIGIGFAVPSSLAKSTIDQLLKYGRTKRGLLGVKVHPVSPEMAESLGRKDIRGGIVMELTEGGPAEKAGLKERDVLIEFDGKKLDDNNRLTRLVGETEVGKEVTLKVLRDNDKGEKAEVELKVTLGEFPAGLSAAAAMSKDDKTAEIKGKTSEFLGMKVAELPKEISEANKNKLISGVVIVDVKDSSSAEDSGLRKGDIITEVNTTKIKDPEDAEKIVAEAKKNNRTGIMLTVIRPGLPAQFVVVQFKALSESSVADKSETKKEEKKEEKKEGKKDSFMDGLKKKFSISPDTGKAAPAA